MRLGWGGEGWDARCENGLICSIRFENAGRVVDGQHGAPSSNGPSSEVTEPGPGGAVPGCPPRRIEAAIEKNFWAHFGKLICARRKARVR